jgi:hypothetical protein
VEAALRAGCIKTRGHPFQVNTGKRTDLTDLNQVALTRVNTAFWVGNELFMQAKKRLKRLNSVVAIRLSSEQAFRLAERARQTGQTASEWGRQTILQALDASLDARLILAETLALRKIVLALQLDLLQGNAVTEQRLRAIVENAESTKFAMTESRLHAARSRNSND